ncbi:MAG TPA: NAD(P)/FAD-dependent oxidoreductase [Actinopolymorphaceae bacterium]
MERFDVAVIGGGHNGLVAACYLARAGLSVVVLERQPHVGGAAVSERTFPGIDARLSRYAYLVSLLPDQIVRDLGLDITLLSRRTASYTPVIRDGAHTGLLVERDPGPATAASFRELTGSDHEWAAWQELYGALAKVASTLAPTMLEPLRSADEMQDLLGDEAWHDFVERPIGEVIEKSLADDAVRGVVLTDALIGTFTCAHDPSYAQNRCFLYHLIGNGSGEWKVPLGGMGAVTAALTRAAEDAGVIVRTNAEAVRVDADASGGTVTYRVGSGSGGLQERQVASRFILAGVAPAVLDRLLGRRPTREPEGCQLKLNLLLTRLPRLASGADPRQAFAGTFHVDEGYENLQRAYEDARAGRLPERPPFELYCHTLTDPSILAPELAEQGWHTLTAFALHMPAHLFRRDNARMRDEAARACLDAINTYLAEPIEDCLARDADGRPCLEIKTPLDIESSVGMPGGHIFHGDLAWPWAERPEEVGSWGVETDIPSVLICGSGARRGGGVSGIGGHNAAHAVLDMIN